MSPIPAQTGETAAERRAERVVEAVGWKRSGKAGNVDPGMETVRAGFVAGERKAVASLRNGSDSGTLIRSRRLAIDLGSGERTGIGRFWKAGQLAADPAERFDLEGRNGPKGEWRPGKRQAKLIAEAATGHERRYRRSRRKPGIRWWSEGPNGSWKRSVGSEAARPGALTLEWHP
jgi:hypothetical protein